MESAQAKREVKIVGRYALYDEIACGGMAAVHFGRLLGPVGFSRSVAIKRLHPHHAKDPQFTKMFIDEARLASRIQHPNVVPILDVVNAAGELLLVMEYIQGECLGRLLRNAISRDQEVPLRIVLAVMSNILHGLHAAHEARSETGEPLEIVHRDISPQNVMVSIDGIAKVVDFGIARAKLRLEETEEGNIKGKVSYMAPEQLAGAPLDRRTDIYAAAVMMWELLAGRRLWHRVDAQTSLLDKMFKAVDRPSMYREDVPDALDGVVLHGLERDANKRFATAREFALAIEQYGPLATPTEVGAWVEAMAKDALSERSLKVAECESDPPMDSARRPAPLKSDTYPVSRPSIPERLRDAEDTPSVRVSEVSVKTHEGAREPRVAPLSWKRTVATAGVGFALVLAAAGLGYVVRGSLRSRTQAAATSGTKSAVAAAPAPPSCAHGMSFVAGGKLFMGDDEGTQLERPAHQVMVSSYCIDTTEVTVEAYKTCSDKGDCKRAGLTNEWEGLAPSDARTLDPLCNAREPDKKRTHPVNCVTWEMASRYCTGLGKRLPTEAEWEYAARGSDGRRYPWGDEAPNAQLLNACGAECADFGKQSRLPLEALYAGDDGYPTTAPVGSFPRGRSRFGADDLVGNVAEWTADFYAAYTPEAQIDPKGPPGGKFRVVRGGAWNASGASARPTARHRDPAEKRSFGIGFRCAAEAK
jgi:eukaryotic-like serine/threonine-protein kinase